MALSLQTVQLHPFTDGRSEIADLVDRCLRLLCLLALQRALTLQLSFKMVLME